MRADKHQARLCRLFSRRLLSAGVPRIPGFLDRRFPLAGDRRVFELRKSRIAVDRRREVSHVAAGRQSCCQAQHQAGDRSGTGGQASACHRRYSAASVGDIARLIAAGWLARQEESVDGGWGQLSGRVKKNEGEWRRACKPGSVESGHFSGMPVARHLERSTRESQRTGPVRQGSLLDLAPGGVYQAEPVTRFAGALLPHRFTLTSWDSEESPIGGLISVALSLSSRTVGVTHHRVLWSPDFPPRGRLRKAPTQRPLGPLRLPLCRSL